MGVFDGVALELGCTPGDSICCYMSFFCSSARPAGAKKVLSARLYSYAIFHRITGARLRWARGKWLGVILYYWPGSQVQTKHKNENGPSPRTSASNTEGWPIFTRLWPAKSRPTSRAGHMQVSKHALYN
jgi:hypothetical protein